ncbi:hypothetical protein BDZ89DRAFT_1138532 [Hymenopellis radicata]|nr:hypothetical protein BDZ89DRAFT_1138532 [Hymenopellis radicata]
MCVFPSFLLSRSPTLPAPSKPLANLLEFAAKSAACKTAAAATAVNLPQEKDGVVDASLNIYGTRIVRVVDLAAMPLHPTQIH